MWNVTESRWRHDIKNHSALLIFCYCNPSVIGGSLHKSPIMRSSFDVIFVVVILNKQVNKQSKCWRYETPQRPWDATVMQNNRLKINATVMDYLYLQKHPFHSSRTLCILPFKWPISCSYLVQSRPIGLTRTERGHHDIITCTWANRLDWFHPIVMWLMIKEIE